jgi:4-methyl-5(b-hydroxyethyl)-thiazole monophosphate biosynthesis
MMNKKALLLLAEGFEDIEAVTPVDILTRAGVDVTVASLEDGPVEGAYGNTLVAGSTIDKIGGLYDCLILPGGLKNAQILASQGAVIELVKSHFDAGKLVAAICAAPAFVLAEAAGILAGRKATGDPNLSDMIISGGAEFTDQTVTVDGNIITAMGPGAALPFALKLAEYLAGKDVALSLAKRWRIESFVDDSSRSGERRFRTRSEPRRVDLES